MMARISEGRPRTYPEPASAGVVLLLSLATVAAGVGAVAFWHAPLAIATLVTGAYTLHLLGLRRSVRDAVVALNDEARREAYLLQQEYESKLLEVSRLEPELERERARLQQQWEHLRGMVDEREGRKESLKQYRQSLEQARKEAHAALEEARIRVREKEARERELEQRIEELESSQVAGFEAQQKLEKLTAHLQELRSLPRRESPGTEPADVGTGVAAANGKQRELERQISDLESEKRSAELALERIASRSASDPGPERSPSAAARLPEPPKLRAWQFVAHKRNSGSRPS